MDSGDALYKPGDGDGLKGWYEDLDDAAFEEVPKPTNDEEGAIDEVLDKLQDNLTHHEVTMESVRVRNENNKNKSAATNDSLGRKRKEIRLNLQTKISTFSNQIEYLDVCINN